MNWPLLISLLATSLLTIFGWMVAQRTGRARDAENRRAKLRVRFLIEAYRHLEGASCRPLTDRSRDNVESAIADIRLSWFPSAGRVGIRLWSILRRRRACFGARPAPRPPR
jgi:hypothetical protein